MPELNVVYSPYLTVPPSYDTGVRPVNHSIRIMFSLVLASTMLRRSRISVTSLIVLRAWDSQVKTETRGTGYAFAYRRILP